MPTNTTQAGLSGLRAPGASGPDGLPAIDQQQQQGQAQLQQAGFVWAGASGLESPTTVGKDQLTMHQAKRTRTSAHSPDVGVHDLDNDFDFEALFAAPCEDDDYFSNFDL